MEPPTERALAPGIGFAISTWGGWPEQRAPLGTAPAAAVRCSAPTRDVLAGREAGQVVVWCDGAGPCIDLIRVGVTALRLTEAAAVRAA